jgi:hypothetical protein
VPLPYPVLHDAGLHDAGLHDPGNADVLSARLHLSANIRKDMREPVMSSQGRQSVLTAGPLMTDEEIRREYFTKHDRYFDILCPQDQKDVIDGICVMSVYEGQPILDYTRRWGE